VALVTAPIARVHADAIETADGARHELDVLVYATGFQASQFLSPMRVRGSDGLDLHDVWSGEPRACLGSIPGFPNLFLLYGPNTNLVVNGSIVFCSECQVRYVVDCIRVLLQSGAAAMAVRRDVHDEHNAALDDANATRAWGASDVSSWYRSASGRISQNWPHRLLDLWERTRRADPTHHDLRSTR
jgi:4-hydroxyacetophenone monooxygenase